MANDWLDCLRWGARRRREEPRIPALGGFCSEITDGDEQYSMLSDVSARGIRIHRPYLGDQSPTVQVEFDLPGVDELIWAQGVVCFARVWETGDGRVLQTTGIELVRAAGKHLRLLRDYAHDRAPRYSPYAERRAALR